MGSSDKPVIIVGSALVALLLIVGFKTFIGIKDKHHQGQPEAGYTAKPEKEKAAPVKADAAAPAAAAPAAAATVDGAAPTAGAPVDNATLVTAGDVAKGKKRFRRCAGCHSYKSGEPSKIGPNLYGLVGRDVASQLDYAEKYSAAMKAKGGKWTLEELSAFITNPKKALPGTGMIFAGLKKDQQRANLLAYIKTLSD